MEVLKVGTRNVVSCGKCGSQLRYGDSDVRLRDAPRNSGYGSDEYEPGPCYRLVVSCPVCRGGTDVPVPYDRRLVERLVESQFRAEHDI